MKDLLKTAKPEHRKPHGYVWWACGSDGHGLNLGKGVIPYEVRALMEGDIPPPVGSGGVWFSTEQEALDELRRAVEVFKRRNSHVHG